MEHQNGGAGESRPRNSEDTEARSDTYTWGGRGRGGRWKCGQEQGSLWGVTVGRRRGSSVQEGRKGCKSSHGANEEVAGDIGRTQGLSKAHLQEWKGLKLQVETKGILNT